MADEPIDNLEDETTLFEEEDTQGVYEVEELFSDPEFPQALPYSSGQVDLTAKLAAATQKGEESVDFNVLAEQNRELIQLGREQVLRNEAKLRAQKSRKAALDSLATNAVSVGNMDEAAAFVELEIADSARELNDAFGQNELEKQGVESLQSAEMQEDPDYAAHITNLFGEDSGSTLDALREQATKTAIFKRNMDAYREQIKKVGGERIARRSAEFGAIMFLPFYDTQSRINVRENEDLDRKGAEFIRAGAAVKRQIEGLWALPLDEFEVEVEKVFKNANDQSGYFFETNETAALHILEQYELGTMGAGGVFMDDVVGVVDGIPLVGAAAKLASGGIKGLAGLAKVAGARKTAGTLHTDAITKTTKAQPEAVEEVAEDALEAIDELIPTAMKPNGVVDKGIGMSGSLSKKLEEIDAIGKELEGITVQGRLSKGQLDELVNKKIKQIEKTSTENIEDLKPRVDPQTKLAFVDMYIGRKKGGGFVSEKTAIKNAERRGFTEYDVVEEDGHFFIKQSHVVEELGPNGIPLMKRPDNSEEVIPGTGPVRAGVQNPALSLPRDLGVRRHEAEMAQIKFRDKIVKPLEKFIAPLNKKELQHLNAVMTKGRNTRKWFNTDEFAAEWKKASGKEMSDKHFTAYAASIKASNIDYAVRNLHVYTEKARRGIKTVSIKDTKIKLDRVNGTERSPNFEQLSTTRLYDVQNGIVRTGRADTAPEELADFKNMLESGEYKVIQLEEATNIDGDPVKTLLVPVNSVVVEPLARQQVNYVPGGHLIRKTPWFGKQARTGKYKDGEEYVMSPSALFAYRTEGSAVGHLDAANDALESYRNYLKALDEVEETGEAGKAKALAEVREAAANSPFESFENLQQLIQAGKVDPKQPIELVYDRGLPSAYWGNNGLMENPNVHKLFDEKEDAMDGVVQWNATTGRDYYGKRTDGLLSPHEEKDVVLDPLASVSKGLENAAKTYAFDHYINRSIEEWVRVAAKYMDVSKMGGTSDVRHLFYNGTLNEQLKINNPNLWNKLEENRTIIKDTMGRRTPTQERLEVAKRNLARFLEGDGNSPLKSKVVMKTDDIMSNNPINAINGVVFDAWLGMGDLSQLWVQTQTILTATAASPKFGAQAVSMFMPMRLMMVNQSENLLDLFAKRGKVLHQQEPEDFKNMVRSYRVSGWNAPGGEMAYLANHSNSVGSAGVVANINKARKALRFPFNEAERWNRLVAWQMAWKQTSQNFPKLAKDSEEFLAEVNKATSDFSISMTAISNSKIQKGVFSPMTRFMGYQFRLLEAILPKSWGGSPAFTNAMKSRMAMAQIILYGGKGMPFGGKISDYAADMIENATGERPNETTTKWLESGAIDAILYTISDGELNTDVADRAGFGRGFDYSFSRMSDGSMGSALEMYGGPALSFSTRYAKSVNTVMNYFKGSRLPQDLDIEDARFTVNELFVKHVNSLKRIEKARMIWRLGRVVDPKSGRPLFDANDLEGAAAFLGVPLYEETHMYELMDSLQNYQDEVKVNGQLIAKLDREAFTLLGQGEEKRAKVVMTNAATIFAQFQDDPRMLEDVARYANNELGYTGTQWSNLLEKIGNIQGDDALPPEGLRYEQLDEEL